MADAICMIRAFECSWKSRLYNIDQPVRRRLFNHYLMFAFLWMSPMILTLDFKRRVFSQIFQVFSKYYDRNNLHELKVLGFQYYDLRKRAIWLPRMKSYSFAANYYILLVDPSRLPSLRILKYDTVSSRNFLLLTVSFYARCDSFPTHRYMPLFLNFSLSIVVENDYFH
jgi:hypothetical protein